MIKNYKENLLTGVMNKIGIADLFNKNIPVVIKQDFVVNEFSLLKAGTIGYIKKAKSYDVDYKKGFAVWHLKFATPNNEVNLLCKIYDDTDKIKVFGLKDTIEFKELLEIADEETSRKVETYCALAEDWENAAWSYDNKTEITAYICYIIAGIIAFAGICCLVSLKKVMILIAAFILAIIIGIVGFVFYVRSFSDTKKGKALNDEVEAVKEEIAKMDEKSCERFADKKINYSLKAED